MRAIAGRAGGGVTVAVGVPLDNTTQVLRFTPAGALESSIAVTGTAAATDGELTITTWSDSESLRFAAYDASGAVQWTRAFAGSATITAMAIDPAHRLVFGGELLTSIDFGGGPLRLVETDDGPINGFVAELSSIGAHVFSTRIGASTVAGVATNGPRIAVSGTTRTQFFYKQLVVFDADHPPSIDIGQLSDNGRGGPVAMSPSGRVWWTFEEQFQLFTGVPYLFAFKAEDRAVR
jgi:outer membrane protein assembly factor BamB